MEILVPPSNNISKQAEDALYEDMQANAANTEPTTEDNVNMASEAFTDHVTVSPIQAYAVTSVKKNGENEREDTGHVYDDTETDHVMVSPNQAYGVISVKKNDKAKYKDMVSSNQGHRATSMDEAEYEYI